MTESVASFHKADWYRIVAVFAHGPEWQFKGWKWESNVARADIEPALLFDLLPGFHVHWRDADIPATAKKWRVTPLPVSRDQRYTDSATLQVFWERVERFMATKRPRLGARAVPTTETSQPRKVGAKNGRDDAADEATKRGRPDAEHA